MIDRIPLLTGIESRFGLCGSALTYPTGPKLSARKKLRQGHSLEAAELQGSVVEATEFNAYGEEVYRVFHQLIHSFMH
jgi:hypothetical protein